MKYKIQSWASGGAEKAPKGFSPYRLGTEKNNPHTFPSDKKIIQAARDTLKKDKDIIISTRYDNCLILHIPTGGIAKNKNAFLQKLEEL